MRKEWVGLLGCLLVVGCESHEATVARCTTQVSKAETRLSRTTPPQVAVDEQIVQEFRSA